MYVFNAVKNMNVPFKCFENYDLIIRILFVLKKKVSKALKKKGKVYSTSLYKMQF